MVREEVYDHESEDTPTYRYEYQPFVKVTQLLDISDKKYRPPYIVPTICDIVMSPIFEYSLTIRVYAIELYYIIWLYIDEIIL